MRTDFTLKHILGSWLTLGLAAVLLGAVPAAAQPSHVNDSFSINPGIGLPDFSADSLIQKPRDSAPLLGFTWEMGSPLETPEKLEYPLPPALAVVSGIQKGALPSEYVDPIAPQGSYRFTLQVLDRYIFGTPGRSVTPYLVLGDLGQRVTPYIDDGRPPATSSRLNIASGPSIGGGLDIPLTNSFSVFVESRFTFASQNRAIYGANTIGNSLLGAIAASSGVTNGTGSASGSGAGGSSSGSGTGLSDPSQNPTSGMNFKSTLKGASFRWAALGLATILLGALPSVAQSEHVDRPFFAKLGAGLSDYTGDYPIQNTGHPLDLQELIRGNGFPFATSSELGYRISPSYAVALGLQVGNYPIAGYGTSELQETNLYTVQLLGRYTFDDLSESIDPYVDGGLNVTLSGVETGYGPSVGGGVAIPLNSTVSVFVESRFNLTLPDDAIDGTSYPDDAPSGSNPKGSVTGPFDSVNQLLGVGLKVSFGGGSEDAPSDTPTSSSNSSPPVEKSPSEKTSSPNATNPHPDTSRQKETIRVPSGTFIMGLTREDPLSLQNAGRKRVSVSSFYIDQYEVTNAEYRDYLSRLSPEERGEMMPDSTAWGKARMQENWEVYFRSDYYANYPVVAVTWNEAQAYCEAQNKRLPTEAEWEYAARAGHLGRVYPWEGMSTRDEDGDYLANFNPPEGYTADGYAFTAPVDAFPPSNWGLYNIAGNVAEWTLDAYTPSYDNISDFNPRYRDQDEPRRVVRGGAWNSDSFSIGVGVRDMQRNDEASVSVGFRCVRDVGVLDQEEKSGSSTETQNDGQNQPQ